MKSTRKKDIQLGKKDLLSIDEFDPKYGKERITLFVDQQVVDAFRKMAKSKGEKYQALMREALRESVFRNPINELENRLAKVEAQVFKKKIRKKA